jgi:hypothetical protein
MVRTHVRTYVPVVPWYYYILPVVLCHNTYSYTSTYSRRVPWYVLEYNSNRTGKQWKPVGRTGLGGTCTRTSACFTSLNRASTSGGPVSGLRSSLPRLSPRNGVWVRGRHQGVQELLADPSACLHDKRDDELSWSACFARLVAAYASAAWSTKPLCQGT